MRLSLVLLLGLNQHQVPRNASQMTEEASVVVSLARSSGEQDFEGRPLMDSLR